MSKTATYIDMDLSEDWVSDARLYHLSEPLKGFDYVIVSGLDADDQGPAETLVAPATPEGQLLAPIPLAEYGANDHVAALASAGYEVA